MGLKDWRFFALSAVPPGDTPEFISSSRGFKEKVKMVVIWGSLNDYSLRIYRESSKVPGMLSCDEYRINGDSIIGPKKDANKYPYPYKPKDAHEYDIHGNIIYTEQPLNKATKEVIAELLAKLR